MLSQVQHIAGNLPKHNLFKAFSVKIEISLFKTNHSQLLTMSSKLISTDFCQF